VFISVTGLIPLYFVHKYRLAGVILFGAGALATYFVYLLCVPWNGGCLPVGINVVCRPPVVADWRTLDEPP
jgi:hypothetical protein